MADVDRAFQGSRQPGRWNGLGRHPVYTASSIALAALERLAYTEVDLERRELRPQHLFRIELPQSLPVDEVTVEALPRGWEAMAVPADPLASRERSELQKLGDAWCQARRAVGLIVPSAHVPEERNVLLNPTHPSFGELRITYERVFSYDRRLLRELG